MHYLSISVTPTTDGPWIARFYLRDSLRTVQGHPRRVGGVVAVPLPGTERMDAAQVSLALSRLLAVEDGHAPLRASREPVYAGAPLPGLD